MDDNAWKDLYKEHRKRTRGQHLYCGPGGELVWSVEDLPNMKKVCSGISQFDKEHRCLKCLRIENDPE